VTVAPPVATGAGAVAVAVAMTAVVVAPAVTAGAGAVAVAVATGAFVVGDCAAPDAGANAVAVAIAAGGETWAPPVTVGVAVPPISPHAESSSFMPCAEPIRIPCNTPVGTLPPVLPVTTWTPFT
jgi:hypothetical protein